jgi:polysaccharide lyase family 4-like protein
MQVVRSLVILALILILGPAVASGQAGSYQEISLDASGTLGGRVVYEGRVPAPLQLLITKDMEICGEGYRERKEIDISDHQGLRNVVVFIEEIGAGKPWSEMETGMSVNQENCFFQPHVQVIPRGAEMDIVNSDSTLHNIHAYELIGRARRSLFNISQPDLGPVQQALRPVRSNKVSLECDSHDFMQGWIFAADHPYVAVVDGEGVFDMPGIPPGTYQLSAWHPRLGTVTREVTVEAESVLEINFTFGVE